MKSDVVRLFQTLPHDCGYFAGRIAQNLVIDPSAPHLAGVYGLALTRGFRRAGGHVYHPHCGTCRACVPCRVDVARFTADRSQRRCRARNGDLEIRVEAARYTEEYFELYQRYLLGRHRGGGMDSPQQEDFSRFLYTEWSPTQFLEIRRNGRLLGVAVTDVCPQGLSAVYTFYDPAETARGLGTFAILSQLDWAAREGLPYVYLGYWIAGHPKMDYKHRFQPLELLVRGEWTTYDPAHDQ